MNSYEVKPTPIFGLWEIGKVTDWPQACKDVPNLLNWLGCRHSERSTYDPPDTGWHNDVTPALPDAWALNKYGAFMVMGVNTSAKQSGTLVMQHIDTPRVGLYYGKQSYQSQFQADVDKLYLIHRMLPHRTPPEAVLSPTHRMIHRWDVHYAQDWRQS